MWNMMELKVWVDGIQRVVCGVTTDTTCQDVVIALAHAMGRTGRFTLIEKWRDAERPLTPGEQPLRVLQKWGEYACEVKLFLCQTGSDKLKQRDRHKQPDRFTHNFSPPKTHSETSIKRNLTFSGPHNTPSTRLSHSSAHLKHGGLLENGVSPRSSTHSSTSSTRSSPHPVPAPRQRTSPGNIPRPAPRHSPLQNGPTTLPNKPSVVRSQPFQTINNLSSTNQHPSVTSHDGSRGSTPSPHTHRHNNPSPNVYGRGSPNYQNLSSPSNHTVTNSLTPITAIEHNLDGPLHSRHASSEIEEYDLDINFPDILRDSNRPDRPTVLTEYRIEEKTDNHPEPERARLLRLVTLQKERLKVQESQLEVIDTEIVSLEEKELEYEHDLQRLTDDLVQLEQREHDDEVELTDLSSVEWVEVLSVEQEKEKSLKVDINELRVKVSEFENQLKTKKDCESKLVKEIQEAEREREEKEKEAEQIRQEKERQCQEEQVKLKTELQGQEEKQTQQEEELEKVDNEIADVEKSLKVKEEELTSLDADLKRVNLEEFGSKSKSPVLGKSADTGEAVLKILEGRMSPRPQISPTTPTQQAFISSLSAKNPNGVWV